MVGRYSGRAQVCSCKNGIRFKIGIFETNSPSLNFILLGSSLVRTSKANSFVAVQQR
jgi:hypothetical protein